MTAWRFVAVVAFGAGMVAGCVAPVEGTGAPDEQESAAAKPSDDGDAGARTVAPTRDVATVHCCPGCGENHGNCVTHL